MKHYLAIDLGASSGRAILGSFDGSTIQLKELHRFSNGPIKGSPQLYWDFNALFSEIKCGIAKALELNVEISGIGIDTWGVDFCYLGADGKFIGLPWHYRDSRTDDVTPWAFERISQSDIYSETGIQFMNLNTIFQLAASKRDGEARLEEAEKLLFIPNALTYLLCGDASAEYSIATTSQLYNPRKRDWSWKIIDALGLKRSLFPEIKPSCTIAAPLSQELCREFNCAPIPVILIGAHDTASAVAAVPVTGEGSWAYLSSGTWSLLGVELDEPLINEAAQAANYTNEGGVGSKIRFLKNIMGMWLIQECRNQWISEGTTYSFAELAKMASEAPAFSAFIDPNAQVFAAPGDMPSRIREYCRSTGQQVPETPGAVVRVALESLALKYRQTWQELENLTSKKLDKLHLVGGGCQNALLNQFTANAIGAPVITGPVEATALGNIIGQALATGDIATLAEGRVISANSFENSTYLPADAELWEKAYQTYTEICRKGGESGIN